MEIVQVELGEHAYPIYIGAGVMDDGERMRSAIPGEQVLVVTNQTIEPLYLGRLTKALTGLKVDVVSLPDGEKFKTLDSFERIISELLTRGHKRSTTVIALGGGVVGDTAGFAAACYQRGVNFIQVPTTLLAQVDSSVGGKTAVNHPLGKNMIGAFHQPSAVFIDPSTLETLPDSEFCAGLAEIIKHGAIADIGYFSELEQMMDRLLARDMEVLTAVIRRSCEIKADVVSRDEREAGERALLNFGHTFGHAIETAMGHGAWLHGQAVGAGMVMAADLSWRLGHLPLEAGKRLEALIGRAGLPVAPPAGLANLLPELMGRDKKATDRGMRFILLDALGEAVIADDVDEGLLKQTLDAEDALLA
ncbi:MAG TPA: 3-dehydroquinate synthase [Pseudomonadales bacterium]|nr:3-dehydroquinate synthase [Pseudomonadales bacterium]